MLLVFTSLPLLRSLVVSRAERSGPGPGGGVGGAASAPQGQGGMRHGWGEGGGLGGAAKWRAEAASSESSASQGEGPQCPPRVRQGSGQAASASQGEAGRLRGWQVASASQVEAGRLRRIIRMCLGEGVALKVLL